MAYLFRQPKSPFWWIGYKSINGVVRESTGLRIGFGNNTVLARRLRDQRSCEESTLGNAKPSEQWAAWVDGLFKLRYADSPNTLLRMRNAWRNLAMYLEEVKVILPRQLTREHCKAYMAWRIKPSRKDRKYRAGHNTAQLELKVLGIVMAEAVECKYAPFNPCRDLRIGRIAVARDKKKPALNDDTIAQIREAIKTETRTYLSAENKPEPLRTFLHHSFEIGYYHGCRLTETHLNPREDVVYFERGKDKVRAARITFNAKGRKDHTVYLHPKLLPLFDELRASSKRETYPMPKSPAKEWFSFLMRIGVKKEFPKACFHSLRVSAASKMAAAGVSKKKAMEFLGHASSTVHDQYIRMEPEDLDVCADAIQ